MPLFKRRERGDDAEPDPAGSGSRVLSERDILDRIEEEIVRADRYARPLLVLCVRPHLLPHENLEEHEMRAAAEAVGALLRFTDRVGVLSDGTIVAVLPETTPGVARAFAHRIAADVASVGSTLRKWLVGTSSFPEDGRDPPAIVSAAIRRAEE